jgi:hypothetical protein
VTPARSWAPFFHQREPRSRAATERTRH